jgi:hypothetical protein
MVMVMVSDDDIESITVAKKAGACVYTDTGDTFPNRIAALMRYVMEPWIFTGSDDIRFTPGWLTGMFAEVHCEHDSVICPNDGHNANGTNYLIRRHYLDVHGGSVGEPGSVFHVGYRHNFADNELALTAAARGVYRRAWTVLVESMHPVWGNASDDTTYQVARAHWDHDSALFAARQPLWEAL